MVKVDREANYLQYKNSAENILVTKLHICATHVLNIIIRSAKLVTKSDKIRHAFVLSFTLLQNATSTDEFERYLVHIYNLYMQPKFNSSCAVSLFILGNELRIRKLYNDIDLYNSQETNNDSDQNIFKYVTLSENEVSNIKLNSPFTIYFDKRIKKISIAVKKSHIYNLIIDPVNEFFNPQLFKLISDRLYNVPMWSGLLIGKSSLKNKVNGTTTRL